MSTGTLETKATMFDYSQMTSELAREAAAAAKRIRENCEIQVIAAIEIGQDLFAIKDQLEHGLFGEWLRVEFEMSDRTARTYMSVAREFGECKDLVAKLPAKTVYAMASPRFPAPVRDRVIGLLSTPDSVAKIQAEVQQVQLEHVVRSRPRADAARLPSVNAAAERAAEEAADLLAVRFGEDLPVLVDLMTLANHDVLLSTLQQRVARKERS